MSSNRTPPLTPTVLYIGSKTRTWRNPPIYRLTAVYATPTTVAVEPVPDAADWDLRPGGKAYVTKHQHHLYPIQGTGAWVAACLWYVTKYQHHLYPIRDNATWQRVVEQHERLQQALDDFADALRELGSYATRLEEAGGIKSAANPLCESVASCDDPDTDTNRAFLGYLIPQLTRVAIVSHTPKMLRAITRYRDDQHYEYTTLQSNCFVCPDDDAWAKLAVAHSGAVAEQEAWRALLSELGTYNLAKPDDFAIGESETALAVAGPAALDGTGVWSDHKGDT